MKKLRKTKNKNWVAQKKWFVIGALLMSYDDDDDDDDDGVACC